MQYSYYHYLSPIVAALALSMSNQVKAAQPVILQNADFASIQNSFNISIPGAKGVLKSTANAVNRLQYLQKNVDVNDVAHIRMQQMYSGFEVYGGYGILHTPASAKGFLAGKAPVTMNGTVYEKLQDELGKPEADFVKKSEQVLNDYRKKFEGQTVSEDKVTPMVYVDDQNKAHWAYRVSVLVTSTDGAPARPVTILDAKTQDVLLSWNDIKTHEHKQVSGKGFGGNDKKGVGEWEYGVQYPFLEMTRDDATEKCYMENKDVKVIDMGGKTGGTKNAMEFTCNEIAGQSFFITGKEQDGYDKKNGAYSPSNDALYSGYVIKHMYHDWYGLEALKNPDGSPMLLVMRVHYGINYQNAFWDGSKMTFGDGGRSMYPLVSLGVAAHEISHGFTEQHADLQYYGQSGGMNEAFSDIAAMAAEFYSDESNTWMIGSEIMKRENTALRYMDKPSKDGRSIDTANDYYDGLDVHYSSGVYNRLFYLMATTSGWNTRDAFDVMVKANVDYWTPRTNFKEGACGLLNAARDLDRSLDDVKAALATVGLDDLQCDGSTEE